MSLLKIKRIPLFFHRFSWEINFHEMTVIPFLMIFVNAVCTMMSLQMIDMQILSYAVLGGTLLSFVVMAGLLLRNRQLSQYGFLYVMFFLLMMGITIVNLQDIKNCFYTSVNVFLNLLIFRYYRDRTKMIVWSFCIALSFCIYANFLHLLTHPALWLIDKEKEGTGYLLGNNYNQMGCRMMIALATGILCAKGSKIGRLNFVALAATSVASLSFVGSMTSLSMVAVFIFFCILPSAKLRKIGILSLFTIYVLFQTFVVFSGNGLENNEMAVYIVEDVLHKDITFTHRTYMWDSALTTIGQSPVWGWGFVDMDWYKSNMTSFATGPHNFILSIFINGGILLFTLFLWIAYKSCIAMKPFFQERTGQCFIMGTICLYFMALMEMFPYPIMIYPLILMKYYRYTTSTDIHQ